MHASSPRPSPERVGLVLRCEGMGDCLFAQAVIRKLKALSDYDFDLFTHRPEVFRACPYVGRVHSMDDGLLKAYPHQLAQLFETEKLPHGSMDTFDFLSVPMNIGTLSFAEKQLEYFPAEPDRAQAFDVVLNTSMTWPTRSWPIENWQRLADELLSRGFSVAVVGKDVASSADNMAKRSPALEGTTNLCNKLSLDQTYYTLRKAGLFVTCQNGLSVLAGATDTPIVVLGMSIEWSKRAIYRRADPHHHVRYVSGGCTRYCGAAADCPVPEHHGELRCVPTYDQVREATFSMLVEHDL